MTLVTKEWRDYEWWESGIIYPGPSVGGGGGEEMLWDGGSS